MGGPRGSGRRAAALGTFAVTFGVGLAMATATAAVATASPNESGDTSSAASPDVNTGTDREQSATEPETRSATAHSRKPADSRTVEADLEDGSDPQDGADPDVGADPEDPEGTEDPVDAEDAHDAEVPEDEGAAEPPPTDTDTETDSAPRGAQNGPDRSAPMDAPSPDPGISTAAAQTPPTPRAARLLTLFGTTLPQHVADGPASPRLKTFLLGILDAIYRRYEHFYLNGAPTADPRQLITRPQDGVVIGRLNAVDPDGDQLRYSSGGRAPSADSPSIPKASGRIDARGTRREARIPTPSPSPSTTAASITVMSRWHSSAGRAMPPSMS